MSVNSVHTSSTKSGNEPITVKEFTKLCLRNWMWILSSLFLFLACGYLYIKCQQPEYERSEEILVKDQEAGGGIGGMASTFASMGLVSGNSNVYNELITITSPAVMGEVVDRLRLDVDYFKEGSFHGTDLFGTNLPFYVDFIDLTHDDAAKFSCDINPDGTLRLYKFISYDANNKKVKHKETVENVKIGEEISTPLGKIRITANPLYKENPATNKEGKTATITVTKNDLHSAIETYSKKVSGDLKEEYADVIALVMKDVSVERAEAVLTEIVNVYNENYVSDKNKIAKATSLFIEDRLRVIEQELGSVDANIAQYQSKENAMNLPERSAAMLGKDVELHDRIINLTNNLELCRYMSEYLKDPANRNKIIPINTGVQSQEVEAQIAGYNDLLLNRNSLVQSSSENNPIVKDYDVQLADLRNAILKGMSNRMHQLDNLLASAKKEQSRNKTEMQSTPTKSLPLLSEKRQQSVMENLYLFLLEKREENELSQKFTADNIRIITPPMGSLRPVSPKKMFIMFFAFVFGLFLPMVVLFIRKVSDTKVREKKDLEIVKIPFAGEIPQVGKPVKAKALDTVGKLKNRKDEKAPLAVVKEGDRDVVNEAFRVIRSNLDFMGGKNSKCEIIMLTSFNPGSGKSFISYNLGLSFALKRKKVLLVDCDLRHGSSSMYVNLPSKGLTNYLNGSTDDWQSLVVPSPANPLLSIMPIGKMPPNPAELLENGRLKELLEAARSDYDYILVDCPPVNIVVDAQIVAPLADRTLFVVRAGLLEKSALTELNEFYDDQKFKKMSVILNGTAAVHSRYYTYGTYQSYNK